MTNHKLSRSAQPAAGGVPPRAGRPGPRDTGGYLPPRASRNLKQGDGPAGCLVGLFVLLLIVGIVILSGLLTMLAWNIGVVGIVAACGGAVGKISLGIAICANIAIGIIGRIFRRQAPASS